MTNREVLEREFGRLNRDVERREREIRDLEESIERWEGIRQLIGDLAGAMVYGYLAYWLCSMF